MFYTHKNFFVSLPNLQRYKLQTQFPIRSHQPFPYFFSYVINRPYPPILLYPLLNLKRESFENFREFIGCIDEFSEYFIILQNNWLLGGVHSREISCDTRISMSKKLNYLIFKTLHTRKKSSPSQTQTRTIFDLVV